jgi:hypothetical protein
MDFRRRLAPRKRGPRKVQKKQRILSPEVLPPPPGLEMPAPPKRGPPPPLGRLFRPLPSPTPPLDLAPQAGPPLFTRSLSEHTDTTPTVLLSPRSAVSSPTMVHAPHENASPPTVPSDASRSSSVENADAIRFAISEYLDEVERRRKAGLPSPRTSQDVDIPIRFYLVSQFISLMETLLILMQCSAWGDV